MIFRHAVERRYGQFRLPDELYTTLEGLAQVQRILASVVVLRCEYEMMYAHFAYHAWCAAWDVVPFGLRVPVYDMRWEEDTQTVRWIRREAGS